jgi:2-octaprenyl-3-methyl-6-methoxy-1,4-benzoquinol hydroxylase/2-octaprenylphenol hydroxylase
VREFNVIIIGGGMVGLAFALELSARRNISIAIIDPGEINPTIQPSFHTRVSAITPVSEAFLSKLGVWNRIARKQPFHSTKVWDQNSHGQLNFNASDEGLERLGSIVENDLIQSALFASLDREKIECIKSSLTTLNKTDEGYQVTLNDQKKLSCQLLIGADGAQSQVRRLSGIVTSEKDYQQQAIIANIACEKSFDGAIWQRFLCDSIIALLPLSDKQASIVWSCKNPLANELTDMQDTDFCRALCEALEYRFGKITLESDRKTFPLIERSANDYVLPNLALIGDAAHNIHPLAGQGVNLGFADAQELNMQLHTHADKALGDHFVLRKYARARRTDNELMAKTMTGLNWIYKENNEVVRWLRGFGMNLIDETPLLKSFLQKHALGKAS